MSFVRVVLLLVCMYAACTAKTQCPPECEMFCQYGKVLDENNCPMCECKPDPCGPSMSCAPPPPDACIKPRYEIIDGVKCSRCYDIVDCEQPKFKCPPECEIFCEYGKVLDENNCPTCQCKPDPCGPPTPCAEPPENECTERYYEMVGNARCRRCDKIVPCN